jgi:hypothetical protein
MIKKAKKNIFYVIFQDEKNHQLEKLYSSKKESYISFVDEESDVDPKTICKRIKYCIKYILKNIDLNFSYLNKSTSNDKFFSAIYYQLNEEGENAEILDKVPIKWYSKYIYENKHKLDAKYRENDFQLLFDEIYQEEDKKLIELKNITSKIITKNNININCADDLIKQINFSYEDLLEEKKCDRLEKFIDTEEVKVCILTTKDINDPQRIFVREVHECQINNENHNSVGIKNKKNIISCHATHIEDFINKFSYEKWEIDKNRPAPKLLISENIRFEPKYKIFKAFKDYMDIIKKKIISNKTLFSSIMDYNDLSEKIYDYIQRQIYKYVFQKNRNNKDKSFEDRTKNLGWITPNMLEIKIISTDHLEYTKKCIQRLDESNSVNDKLSCIREAHASLNNAIKFSEGTESDAGQDEITPLFQYIIIKAHPYKIISNMNYIKTFLDESELSGSKGFLVTQIESAVSYIDNINNETLKMSLDEYNRKIDEWKKSQ